MMNKNAQLLGYAGLIPFVSLPLLVGIQQLSVFQGALYFNQYSAIILSFFGGVHWYAALNEPRYSHQLYVAMLPSIFAWLSIAFLAPGLTLCVLALSYVLMVIYDIRFLSMPNGYNKMRMKLTIVVVACHMLMYWLSQ